MYYESMKCMFHQIPVELPKPLIYKEKTNNYYTLLEEIFT